MKNDSYPASGEDGKVVRAAQPYHLTGLCSSCAHTKGCVFLKDRQAPVLFCEEFEIDPAPPPKKTESAASAQSSPANSGVGNSNLLLGLCSNCAHRKTCIYPKPEGGIWHCEEYQ